MLNHLPAFFKNKISRSIGIVFSLVGMSFGTWAAFIPFVKTKFGLDEAELGLLLLTLPLGIAFMNPLCIPFLRRYGSVLATVISIMAVAAFLILPINMPSIWWLAGTLMLFGMAYSATNIAMNTCATQMEYHAGMNIMSTCHGMWSGGVMIGSALAGAAQGLGVKPEIYVIGVAVFVLWMGSWIRKPLSGLPDEQIGETTVKATKAFIRPNKALWLMIIVGICIALAEGTMADWAALYVKEVMDTPASVASWGFSTYAFFMMSGRFLGDGLIGRYGGKNMLRWAGILTTFGYLICVFAPYLFLVFIGLSMIGLGVSVGSPILYAASSKVPGLPKGAGLAIFTTYAMIGFLGGPVLIGFIAKAFSLPLAFGVVAAMAATWVVISRWFR
ncbi:MAG: MFS transporter [Bacteroidota bacterium]